MMSQQKDLWKSNNTILWGLQTWLHDVAFNSIIKDVFSRFIAFTERTFDRNFFISVFKHEGWNNKFIVGVQKRIDNLSNTFSWVATPKSFYFLCFHQTGKVYNSLEVPANWKRSAVIGALHGSLVWFLLS